ncbi:MULTISPECIES: DUF2252 domain-containing protein [Niastella]|uniref:DUF2252 family protein n=1 Tax=Niastella soli TaxID=2821487 RepID=A0ABS3Z3L3_9BACT|nr:DUF2252 family protein [Niastella soli]MBO9204757.1 DUF2252 family protein [Niastella soli]
MPSVVERIQNFNSNRLPFYTRLKYEAMAKDPFYFFRGTAHLFYEDLASANALPASPLIWACGDLHLENFGSYKGDNRLVYFDLNDFDESALAPAAWELTRMLTSIFVGLIAMGVGEPEAKNMALLYLKSYSLVLSKGRSRYIEPQTAKGIVRSFLLKVGERKQKDLIKERTIRKNGNIALLVDRKRLFPINDPALTKKLTEFVDGWMVNVHHHRFQVIDSGFRIAGTGSLGVKRYLFLLERLHGEQKYLLLDMKLSLPSSLQSQLSIKQPAWLSEAARVVSVQEWMQNISPALLRPVLFNNESYVIKEMQPTADKINFATLENRFDDIEKILENMALLTASAQLRSSGRQGSAIADELMAFGRDEAWMPAIIEYARQYANQVKADFNQYLAAYTAGHFGK